MYNWNMQEILKKKQFFVQKRCQYKNNSDFVIFMKIEDSIIVCGQND
jgi:hypothetical protein